VICQESPSCSKICRIWRTRFYIYGWTIVQTVALRWAIFKQKKGSATICLGLIYCFMGSSQPPTRDTVPLIWEASKWSVYLLYFLELYCVL
jgi:hypothetical protein